LHAQTNGKIAPCCMAAMYDDNELGDLQQNANIHDAWNSDKMKQLRLNMLNGKKSSLCTNCYQYEKVGKFSERMQYNQDFKRYYSRVTATMQDGNLKDLDVPLIDIRFSNKCNYKCRICNSDYSSLWYEEELKTGRTEPSKAKEMKPAMDDAKFWESFERLLPDVERLHFAGGEPLFMDEHYRTLEHLIAIGKTDVNLTYNTNFSTLRYKKNNVIDLWNKFHKVDVWASLDDMGDRGDYQRKGQRWRDIEDNIRTLQRECPPAVFGVNVTVNIFNVLQVPEFYRYMVENKFVQHDRMNLYLLFFPHYFSIVNLSPALKQKALQQFESLESELLNRLPDASKIRNHVQAVITHMMSENGTKQKEFRHWIKAIDKVRGENFSSTFPELAEMMLETE
jgi:MoaA/NifB/PqqE/SkfB family radical SAM enzyme